MTENIANPERINNGCMIYREGLQKCDPDSTAYRGGLPNSIPTLIAGTEFGAAVQVAIAEPGKRLSSIFRALSGRSSQRLPLPVLVDESEKYDYDY